MNETLAEDKEDTASDNGLQQKSEMLTAEMASKQKEDNHLETAPFDPRFPNMNQTRYCYQSYVDYHRCQKVKGEGYSACQYFERVFKSLCPNAWIEKWDSQVEEGVFPGKI